MLHGTDDCVTLDIHRLCVEGVAASICPLSYDPWSRTQAVQRPKETDNTGKTTG
jgi:hypothetical protein